MWPAVSFNASSTFAGLLISRRKEGTRHDDLGEGVRTLGFERSLTIVFQVDDREVRILRIFRAGRDWEADLSDD